MKVQLTGKPVHDDDSWCTRFGKFGAVCLSTTPSNLMKVTFLLLNFKNYIIHKFTWEDNSILKIKHKLYDWC